MADPITLTPVAQPTQARASLTAEQVAAFQTLLGGAGLVALPPGKAMTDIQGFMVNVQPNGGGFLSITLK